MKRLLGLYFSALRGPTEDMNGSEDSLSVAEFIWCSWPFALLQGFYSVATILLGVGMVSRLESQYGISSLSDYIALEQFHLKQWMIISTLLSTILFPFVGWIYVKFWKMFTLFFAQLFNTGGGSIYQEQVENSVAATLSANSLLAIPLLGGLLKKMAAVILLFLHLRRRLNFSRYQAVVVLLGPLLVVGILLVLLTASVGIYLNIV